MKFLPLIWAALNRRKARTIFTLLAVVVAFVLFGVLAAIRQGMVGQLSFANAERMVTLNKAAPGNQMPLHYLQKIAKAPGVKAVTPIWGFDGYYRDPKNRLNVTSAHPHAYFKIFPEMKIPAARRHHYFHDRQGAIAGAALAKRMGWHVGQTIPVQSHFPKKNGDTTWYFHLDGIYHADLPTAYQSLLTVHYRYVNEAITAQQGKDTVSRFFERIADPRKISEVSAAIDNQFEHSSPQTYTQSSSDQALGYIREFGNVGAIVVAVGGAVFFSLLLIVTNTMGQSVRERTAELAVLKTLGFGRFRVSALVLVEAVLLTGVGGLVGLGLGYEVANLLKPSLGSILQTFGLTGAAVGVGVAFALAFGLLASFFPMRQVTRLNVADALRKR
jgi:putative ABC transport system permease protein